jgi:hypothetical protein
VKAFSHTFALGMAVCDDRLRFSAINEALAAMNGLAVDSHLGFTVRDVLGQAAENIEPCFRKVLSTGQPIFPFELVAKLPTRTGYGYWIETFFPMRSKSGKLCRVAALIVEVTKQRELEAFLLRFQKQIYPSRAREAQLLVQDLRASVNGYHSALAMSLSQLSREVEIDPHKLFRLVTLLDQRLKKTQALVAEVATRFPIGLRY